MENRQRRAIEMLGTSAQKSAEYFTRLVGSNSNVLNLI